MARTKTHHVFGVTLSYADIVALGPLEDCPDLGTKTFSVYMRGGHVFTLCARWNCDQSEKERVGQTSAEHERLFNSWTA
jgi:hypothetical protein